MLEDQQYQNAWKNSGRQNNWGELDSVFKRLVTSMVKCQTDLYNAYTEDGNFREWLHGGCSGQHTKARCIIDRRTLDHIDSTNE